MDTVNVYRVWNITRQHYERPSKSGSIFFNSVTGAKLGIRHMKKYGILKNDAFEIHEYEAIYKQKVTP